MQMIRATKVEPAASDTTLAEERVLLDFDARYRRRTAMRAESGFEFLLDLERAQRLRHGDLLVLEDGRRVQVAAAPEDLAEIRSDASGGLARLAWHLGNRHLPVMLAPDHIRIRRDHVIEDMVRGLGGTVTPVHAPFDPERGAYAGGHVHAHEGQDGA
jgi:urease accessory protein